MNIRALSIVLALLFSTGAFGQKLITLDSVDVDVSAEVGADAGAVPGTEAGADTQILMMQDCLFQGDETCDSAEYGGSSEITLGDIRMLGVIDRDEMPPDVPGSPPVTEPLPSIDLEIQFAYNSDELIPSAYSKLQTLIQAMADPRIQGQRLVFIGHTDATGSAAYNLGLSQRRADTVADYVRAITGVEPDRIAAVGVGFTRLKNVYDPEAAENRRVQLVLVPLPVF